MKGLTVHASSSRPCRIRYRLGKAYRTFEAVMALNDSAKRRNLRGVFQFSVLGDGRTLWKSKPIGPKRRQQKCSVRIENVDVLEIQIRTKGSAASAHTVILDPVVKK